MLNPRKIASDHASIFDPPQGLVFVEALGAAYSLDPDFALQIPVHAACQRLGCDSSSGQFKEWEAFNAATEYSRAISIFVQAGRISVPAAAANAMFGLLEKMVVSVDPAVLGPEEARGGGAIFHPKFWLVRFMAPKGSKGGVTGPAHYRLAVLTRNLTHDKSLDLCLRLDGQVVEDRERRFGVNRPLEDLLVALSGMVVRGGEKRHFDRIELMAEEIGRVHWELPSGVANLSFFVHGLPNRGEIWTPPASKRMVVMSPFCSDGALRRLADGASSSAVVISRSESLDELGSETLSRFERRLVLREMDDSFDDQDAEAEPVPSKPQSELSWRMDGEQALAGRSPAFDGDGANGEFAEGELAGGELAGGDQIESSIRGLHAKFYLFELVGGQVALAVGSANATESGIPLKRSRGRRNVELLVQLEGKKSALGGVDDLLGPNGLEDCLEDYEPRVGIAEDSALKEAEKVLEAARQRLARADLTVRCLKTEAPETWELKLEGDWPSLEGLAEVAAWPITAHERSAALIDLQAHKIIKSLNNYKKSIKMIAKSVNDDKSSKAVNLDAPENDGRGVKPDGQESSQRGAKPDGLESRGRGRGNFSFSMGEYSKASLTGLIAFRLTASMAEISIRFALSLPVKGLPKDRDGAILARMVPDEASFFRYLSLLCDSEDRDPWRARESWEFGVLPEAWDPGGDWLGDGWRLRTDVPVLERLVKLYDRNPDKLRGMANLIESLVKMENRTAKAEEFLKFWSSFDAVLGD